MPSLTRTPLVLRVLSQHPYHRENECLTPCVQLVESQLDASHQENSTLTSALRDTSISLEDQQQELEQLRTSACLLAEQEVAYDCLSDQMWSLVHALPGPPEWSLLEKLQELEEDLQWLVQQQSLVDKTNSLAICQQQRIESLQEEVHCFCERALFVEKMVCKYLEEGSYSVSLPSLAKVEGKLNTTLASLCCVATFAHQLYCSNPSSVFHQHNWYVGVLIEAVISFLCCGLDSSDPDVVTHSFQIALQYMEAARHVHAELHFCSLSSVQWFFDNTAKREEGAYCLLLVHSQFPDNSLFLTVAQHAGFMASFKDSLEPLLHQHMFALDTALPHYGVGNWEDLVPAVPSLYLLMQRWEAMMLDYIHFVTDTPFPEAVMNAGPLGLNLLLPPYNCVE
ncbi:hypothetical protein EV368DRAFT_88319 [Lentinula lateritia]|nr:hypothetical protein EV368DRAFT_88319 [Lentinula lateritia]